MNNLGVIATALFIIIPTSFLIILYVKSASEGNVSGGFSQEYYDKSKAAGNKKTNEAPSSGVGPGVGPGARSGRGRVGRCCAQRTRGVATHAGAGQASVRHVQSRP